MDGGYADQNDVRPDDYLMAMIGLVHIVGVICVGWFIRRCCCRKSSEASSDPCIVQEEHLQTQKSLTSSYILWFCVPFTGAHHFYLDRVVHGVICVYTLNFFGLGWAIDAFLMPRYVRAYNAKRVHPNAPCDMSRRNLCCKLPLLMLFIVGFLAGAFLYTPFVMHRLGVVDIDRIAAQTEENPFDILGIPHTADLTTAKNAYRKESLSWHPDRNVGCGKRCERKMADITRAFEQIKKRRAPGPADRSWEAWAENIVSDWSSILKHFETKYNAEDNKAGRPKAKSEL